jgi:hypothetical protein
MPQRALIICPRCTTKHKPGAPCPTCKARGAAARRRRYDTVEHDRRRAAYLAEMADGATYRCTRPDCPHPDDLITADAPWDLAHRADGTYAGPQHEACNRATNRSADDR